MVFSILVLAAEDSMLSRVIVCCIAIVIGVIFIVTGKNAIKTKTIEETGRRRLVNKAMGRSNTYTGKSAVNLGWLYVIMGIGAIIFGISFIFVGPFLAQ